MSNEIATQDNGLPVLTDDTLIHIAEQAEKRIDAVIKIKQIALKVTNKDDWVDQEGKPYLMASGSEKVANLFNISWRIDEPVMEQEADGAVTYNYKGEFSLAGRTIEVEGSRSSRDTFFKKYIWENGKKTGEKPLDRRDLKMAAYTNLLGNGITRILGIRNLTYADLEKYAGIKQSEVKGVKYKKDGEEKKEMRKPGEKKASEPSAESGPSARDKLKAELEAYCGEDVDMMKDVVDEISFFESNGKEYCFTIADIFAQKDSGEYRISDKWIGKALGKLRDIVKENQG